MDVMTDVSMSPSVAVVTTMTITMNPLSPILDRRRFYNDDDGEGSPPPLSGNPPPKLSKKTPSLPLSLLLSSVDDLTTTMGWFARPCG